MFFTMLPQTFCIKSNNANVNKYIVDNLMKIKNINLRLSVQKFSLYTNIIIHYGMEDKEKVISKLSTVLYHTIIIFYSKYLIYSLLNTNYFYFSDIDKAKIYDYCVENSKEKEFRTKQRKIIKKTISSYFSFNKKLILTGFINFSLRDYLKELDIILKCYINSQPSNSPTIYLHYSNENSILLDENGEFIPIVDNLKSKYLSDINFSKNDYCLNTLLNLLPENLIICHNSDLKDEFLTTLELIFEDRISYREECTLDIATPNNII